MDPEEASGSELGILVQWAAELKHLYPYSYSLNIFLLGQQITKQGNLLPRIIQNGPEKKNIFSPEPGIIYLCSDFIEIMQNVTCFTILNDVL